VVQVQSAGTFVARLPIVPATLTPALPPEWGSVASSTKTLLAWPDWSAPAGPPSARAVARRGELQTSAGQTIGVVIPLADEKGVGLEGVRLRLVAWPDRREHDVTATLEVPGGRGFVTIARVDCWPPSPHVNTVSRNHAALRHLPRMIDGHHVHRFDDNICLGRAAFAPLGNLPAADHIDGTVGSFRDFLQVVGYEFRVLGIEEFHPPDWHGMMF
jgi:hypothetical protein